MIIVNSNFPVNFKYCDLTIASSAPLIMQVFWFLPCYFVAWKNGYIRDGLCRLGTLGQKINVDIQIVASFENSHIRSEVMYSGGSLVTEVRKSLPHSFYFHILRNVNLYLQNHDKI